MCLCFIFHRFERDYLNEIQCVFVSLPRFCLDKGIVSAGHPVSVAGGFHSLRFLRKYVVSICCDSVTWLHIRDNSSIVRMSSVIIV